MAKKTKTVEDAICERFGDGVITTANSILEKERRVIPISPAFDIVLGGILEGTLVSLAGESQCGKTSLAIDFASTCQKPEYGGKKVFFYNIEGRIRERNLCGIDRNQDKFSLIESKPGNILKANDYLQIGAELIEAYPNTVHIFDSFGMFASSKDLTTDFNDNAQPGEINRLINRFIRRIATTVPVNNNIVIVINHVYANVSGYGKSIKEKISSEVKFFADYRFLWKKDEAWNVPASSDNQIGQIMHVEIVKSATCSPNRMIKSYLRYGVGLDRITELIEIAINIGAIQKGGAWYTLSFLDDSLKVQGMESVYQHMNKNPEDFEKLQKHIEEVLK